MNKVFKYWRNQLKLTQKEVAARAGLNESGNIYICAYERGRWRGGIESMNITTIWKVLSDELSSRQPQEIARITFSVISYAIETGAVEFNKSAKLAKLITKMNSKTYEKLCDPSTVKNAFGLV